jgi:glutaredoxin
MVEVTILSRHECHLCDVVERMARQVQAEVPFVLIRVNIDEQDELAARYGDRVPVVLIDGQEMFAGKVTEGEFRRAIKRARWRRPISRILSRLRSTLRRG